MRAEVLKGHLDGLLLSMLEPAPSHGYAVIELRGGRSNRGVELPTGPVNHPRHRHKRARLVQG